MSVVKKVNLEELKSQRDLLSVEVEIAEYRAELIEISLRRMRAQGEFNKERAKVIK